MPGKVEVAEGESIKSALRRLRKAVASAGGLRVGPNLRQRERLRRKDYYLKPSAKRQQRKKVTERWRRRAGADYCEMTDLAPLRTWSMSRKILRNNARIAQACTALPANPAASAILSREPPP
ncbi:MAG: 30S ribosomal protein S21 [Planctomycetia bacterium]|nr:30S ribosomal protein S21 [Planctomycetia bacterium]